MARFLEPVSDTDLYAPSLLGAKKTGKETGKGTGKETGKGAKPGAGSGADHPNSLANVRRRHPDPPSRQAWARRRMARILRARMLTALRYAPI